ncbi:MAG: 4Fe-4S dicluster domain-containing protein [Anaerolineae bacterium]
MQCIRCSACLNICPVYRAAGGHAYGSPYSGPIGAVITPLLFGLEEYAGLPHASSLCGACRDVCPARIDLPRLLLELRAEEVQRGLLPAAERMAERAVAWGLGHQRLYQLGAGLGRLAAKPFTHDGYTDLPARLNPAQERRLPALAPRSVSGDVGGGRAGGELTRAMLCRETV